MPRKRGKLAWDRGGVNGGNRTAGGTPVADERASREPREGEDDGRADESPRDVERSGETVLRTEPRGHVPAAARGELGQTGERGLVTEVPLRERGAAEDGHPRGARERVERLDDEER